MDPESLSTDTGVWPALKRLVARVSDRLEEEGLTPAEFKDLSTTLSNVAKVEIQASMIYRSPGRPPKDTGSPFESEDSEDIELDPEEENSDG